MLGADMYIGRALYCDRVRPLNSIEVPSIHLAKKRIEVLNEQFLGLRETLRWLICSRCQ